MWGLFYRLNTEQEAAVTKLKGELSRLKEQSVDHQQLLLTITNDKETISRYSTVVCGYVLLFKGGVLHILMNMISPFTERCHRTVSLRSSWQSSRKALLKWYAYGIMYKLV